MAMRVHGSEGVEGPGSKDREETVQRAEKYGR